MRGYDLIIFDKRLSEHIKGVSLSSFIPESPKFERKLPTSHPLRNGIPMPLKNNMGRYTERKITVKITVEASNSQQFHLKRDALYKLFVQEDPYYVTYTWQPLKRWLVTCDDVFSVFQENGKTWQEVEIPLTAIQGVAESVYNSQASFNLIDNKFHFGMNIGMVDNPSYSFVDKESFEVYNLGDITLSPVDHNYQVEMYIEGKDVSISNETTGESVTLLGQQSKKNKLTLLMPYIINGSKVINTKGRFPTLKPGENKFRINGATNSNIKFITHFYYK